MFAFEIPGEQDLRETKEEKGKNLDKHLTHVPFTNAHVFSSVFVLSNYFHPFLTRISLSLSLSLPFFHLAHCYRIC